MEQPGHSPRRKGARSATGPDAASLARSLDGASYDDILQLIDLATGKQVPTDQRQALCDLMVEAVEKTRNRKLFLPLVKALRTGDPLARQAVVRCLPLVNDPKAHVELCAVLTSNDPSQRGAAAQVLSRIGGHTVLDYLTDKMGRHGFPGRAEGIEIVCRIAGHRSLPALQGALAVATVPERHKVIRFASDPAYMAADRVGALSTLRLLLSDRDESVVAAAVRAFGSLATEEEWFDHVSPVLENSAQQVVTAAVESLRHFSSQRVITVLHGRLRAGPKALRMAVLDTLQAIGTDRVLPLLVVALAHQDLPVRTRAGEVLAELGTSGKVDIARTVLWLLRSPEAGVRRLAVGVARQVKDPNATLWPRLFELLRDEDWWVRERVADALIALAGAKMLGHLVRLLADDDPPIRMFAVDVIGRLGEVRALGALVRVAMDDPDWWVRERSMEAIASLGDLRAAPYLVRILGGDPSMRISALDALARLKATDQADAVVRLLADPESDVRLSALRCLEALDDPRVAPSLQGVAEDPRAEVRDLARQLQARWKARLDIGANVWAQAGSSPLDQLLVQLCELGADDLVLAPGQPPLAKRMGAIVPLADKAISPEAVAAMILPILSSQQLEDLQARRDVDLSHEVTRTGARFRANVFQQIHGMGVVFRVVRSSIPSLEELGLPPQLAGLHAQSNGLVLVGGATGSGKSTTLAALIDTVNRTSPRHVVTLEDPIEVVHGYRRGLVNQREIGTHTGTYAEAMRATLREDPDVILVGELRDLDTIRFAVTAAETGHLVLGTVHTVAADTTVDRLINIFPPGQQAQVRTMLAGSLRAIICQNLLPRADGNGRVLACEILFNSSPIANLIRTGKSHQLLTVVSTSRDAGMQTMDSELMRLYREGAITAELAYLKARNKADFEQFLGGASPPAAAAQGGR
ncbi:PilT/PilU family type 4a pilus ATPase [Myxococcota bacterium]|nr:PilT/PilU family type 4a pilus ATPase [Myxococcota bacterium]